MTMYVTTSSVNIIAKWQNTENGDLAKRRSQDTCLVICILVIPALGLSALAPLPNIWPLPPNI
jgi:hypothetical protein